MFTDKISQKIYAHERLKNIPVLFQMEAIQAVEEVLEQEVEEFPYINLFQIFEGKEPQ